MQKFKGHSGAEEEPDDHYKLTNFGEVSVVLGIRVRRKFLQGTTIIEQESYCDNVLKRFNMEDCKGKDTPIDDSIVLTDSVSPSNKKEATEMEMKPYREAVGSLMYLMISTRPDLAVAVQAVSRFGANPGLQHWNAVLRIFQYLKKTKSLGLKYSKLHEPTISGYCDANFNRCLDSRRSTTGYVFKLGGGATSWRSKRQHSVVLSTAESEYVAACEATREAMWGRSLLEELGSKQQNATLIHSDSTSALSMINNAACNERMKHIDVKCHDVREKAAEGHVTFKYCPTDLMIADSLTKGVPKPKVKMCNDGMGLV